MKLHQFLLLLLIATLWACESDDDTSSTGGTTAGTTAGAEGGTPAGAEGGTPAGAEGGTPVTCVVAPNDYPGSTWGACISDDGTYHSITGSTSAAARTAVFEAIGDLLWRNDSLTATSFVDAELLYAEDEGLQSRVVRRYDAHVAKPEGADCKQADAGTLWPEYCVGPAKILPVVLSAFDGGQSDMELKANARRLEAGLLWFFFVSTFKESYSCKDAIEDCDSSLGYNNGSKQLSEDGIGFGGLVQELDANAYQALFNAHLAVRCWREADSAEVSTMPDVQQKALDQLDRALNHGLALILSDRLTKFAAGNDAQKAEYWAFLEVLGPVIQDAAEKVDATMAGHLAMGWAQGAQIDVEMQKQHLMMLFPCP
jgi:hypothetical protein